MASDNARNPNLSNLSECFIRTRRHHHRSILANLVSRPDTAQQSLALFAKQVNPGGDCREFIIDSFCNIMAFLLPWFAAQSRTDAMDLASSEQRAKSEQARKSHDFLVSILTQDVSKFCLMSFNFSEYTFKYVLGLF